MKKNRIQIKLILSHNGDIFGRSLNWEFYPWNWENYATWPSSGRQNRPKSLNMNPDQTEGQSDLDPYCLQYRNSSRLVQKTTGREHPWLRCFIPCLVLVQSRKICLHMTKNCWLGCKILKMAVCLWSSSHFLAWALLSTRKKWLKQKKLCKQNGSRSGCY